MIPKSFLSILLKPPPQFYLEINSTKLPYASLMHVDHSHGKVSRSPTQYSKVKSYILLCRFRSRDYPDTFHSSKNSTILGSCLNPPSEHFTPLPQPHLSNIWGTSFVVLFSCLLANSKEPLFVCLQKFYKNSEMIPRQHVTHICENIPYLVEKILDFFPVFISAQNFDNFGKHIKAFPLFMKTPKIGAHDQHLSQGFLLAQAHLP